MKKLRFGYLAIVAAIGLSVVSFTGCKSGSQKTATAQEDSCEMFCTDSIVFSEKVDSAVDCRIVVDYPTGNDSLAAGVRSYIATQMKGVCQLVMGDGTSEAPSTGYNGALEDGKGVVDYYGKSVVKYLKAQYDEISSAVDGVIPGMSFDLGIRKTAETDRYITYQSDYYVFLGGAHGSAGTYQANIVKKTGEVLGETVDTLKVKEMQPILRKYVLEYIKGNGDAEVTDKNLDDFLFIENGIIPLPGVTPWLAEDGLHFSYQQYEIGPYAMGMVCFTVPYAEVKPFMTRQALELIEK